MITSHIKKQCLFSLNWNQFLYASSISAQANSDQWQRKETSSGTTQSSKFTGARERPSGKPDIVRYQKKLILTLWWDWKYFSRNTNRDEFDLS